MIRKIILLISIKIDLEFLPKEVKKEKKKPRSNISKIFAVYKQKYKGRESYYYDLKKSRSKISKIFAVYFCNNRAFVDLSL